MYSRVLLVAIAAFLIGLTVTVLFYNLRIDSASAQIQDLERDFSEGRSALLFFQTFKGQENFCASFSPLLQSLADQANAMGDRVYSLEKVQNYNDPNLLKIKQDYTLRNIELWLYIINLKTQCSSSNIHTILYFYTNEPGKCMECGAQLIALEDVRNSDKNIWVFAVERNIQLSLIDAIALRYNVQTLPSLVIDEKNTLSSFQSKTQIEAALR
ncbi:MAG: hypothetical protein V1847_04415 [Candidatus Diapherotrites archaeon]